MNLSNQPISKQESGKGHRDVYLLVKMSSLPNINIEEIQNGKHNTNDFVGGNMGD